MAASEQRFYFVWDSNLLQAVGMTNRSNKNLKVFYKYFFDCTSRLGDLGVKMETGLRAKMHGFNNNTATYLYEKVERIKSFWYNMKRFWPKGRKTTWKSTYLISLKALFKQESQNRCPHTDIWTAFRTGRWHILQSKFSATAGTKKDRCPGIVKTTKIEPWYRIPSLITLWLINFPVRSGARLTTEMFCE